MIAIVLLLAVPVAMWIAQSIALRACGRPIRAQLGGNDLPLPVEQTLRAATHTGMACVVLVYPLLRGMTPLAYYAPFFRLDSAGRELAWGAAAATLYLSLLHVAWAATDQARFEVRHRASRIVRKLLLAPVAGLLIAAVEELLFRAVLLADLLESLPVGAAIAVGTIAFASAHYVRRVKRYWTIVGHLALGLLLCTAFVATHTLWLPLGLHAAGVTLLSGMRPLVRYTGPPWLVGASIFPYAGVVGVAALILLTLQVWLRFGGALT